jgi:hypothetical protein
MLIHVDYALEFGARRETSRPSDWVMLNRSSTHRDEHHWQSASLFIQGIQ